ncbi:MAG: hypothetical protein RhofKO_11630 [Rhodothermales bacterium]
MSNTESLLAVDLGLRTGLALYGRDGRLRWYRSHNFGSRARLKKGVYTLFRTTPGITHVVLEGGGDLALLWTKEARRRNYAVQTIDAHRWRNTLLLPREQRSGALAKAHADTWARRVIEWSGAAAPTSLRHDAAEAIMIGLWGVCDLGWLAELPMLS